MMSNTYPSSIISVRTSFSFNGYSYYPNERCPSSYFTCCCSIPLNSSRLMVPINPSSLYGLRQSTLIQLPPSRRLILGSSDRYYCRSPSYNVGQHFCGEICCVKQDRVDRFVEKSCKDECCVKKRSVRVNEIRSRMGRTRSNYRCSALGDAEAMIDLLTENSIEECLDVRGRRGGSFKEGRFVQKQNDVNEKAKERKENVGLESETRKIELGRGRVRSREDVHLSREEMKPLSREEDRRSRRGESSSSYHSFSDLGDFESDMEVQVKHGGFDKESSFRHEKGSRKAGGIVIREESQKAKQDSKTYREQQLQSSTHDDSKVGNSTEWDWRKKSEKKLTEESAEVTKSSNVSVVRKSQLNHSHENNSMKSSSSKKHSNYEEGESSSGVSFHGHSSSHIKAENQVSDYLKSSNRHEQSMHADRNEAKTTSSMWRISNEGEEGVKVVGESAQERGCEYCEECGEIMQQSKIQTDFQQHAQLSEIRDDFGGTLVVQNQSEGRLRKQENNSTSLQSSGMEALSIQNESESRLRMQEKSSTSHQTSVTEENKQHMRNKSQNYSETVDTHDRYGESSSRSQRRSESRMKNLEEYSTSIISRQDVKGLEEESRGKVIKEIVSNKESQTALNASQLHSTNVEINRQSISEQRIYNEQTYSTTKVTSVEELVEKRKQINETNVQSGVSSGKQGQILQATFTGNSLGEITVTQPSVTLISQTGVEQVNKGEIESNLQISVISPSYQHVGKSSPCDEPSISLLSSDNASNTELGGGVTIVQSQVKPASSSDEMKSCERTSFEEHSPEDALASAIHMESVQIVGEFVEKTSHEASSSETKLEKQLSRNDSNHQDQKCTPERSTKSNSEKTRLQKQDSRHSSGGSGTKRPLGEMWVVKDHLPQESSEIETSEGATSGDVVNRNGKSLWSIITRIFRLRWESKSETQTSPVKSGGWKSSHDSASSETRVSRKETNEATSDSLDAGQTSLGQKPISSDQTLLKRNASRPQKGNLGVMCSDDKITDVKMGASSSSSVLQTGLLLGVMSSGANANWNVAQQMPQFTSSNSSINPARRSKKSYSSEKIEEFGQNEGIVSSKEEQRDHSLNVRQSDVSTSEIIVVEPKNGKLKRSEQVLEERFDKWEDAYKHENEQRRVDEIFMREALVEAKKAADSWEVPVGAVLVQNGKIIARGYNLVEELRDSTAHAEIICIREGSSVLRTWRLSETTLYVTLEPCPMCAGAVLQARVGTLVWGAPNKLLGADGSWIRLFPGGAEGEQRPEVADKPAAPVHPFHPKMKIRRGVLEPECAEIMQQFFQLRRRNKKKKEEKKSDEPGQPSCLPIAHHPSKLLHKMHDIFHIMFCL